MSERDVGRMEVLAEVVSGRRTVASAAIVLAIGVRQVHRLPKRSSLHARTPSYRHTSLLLSRWVSAHFLQLISFVLNLFGLRTTA